MRLASFKRRCLLTTLLSVCALAMLVPYLTDSYHVGLQFVTRIFISVQNASMGGVPFVPINEYGIFVYRNVCFEPTYNQPNVRLNFEAINITYKELQKIVVYDSQVQFSGVLGHEVSGPFGSNWNQWSLEFKPNTSIPTTHVVLEDAVAYFTSLTYPGNIHHFWSELFLPIYSVVERTGRLHPGARNYLFYRRPYHLVPPPHVFNLFNMTRFDELLDTLYMARNRTVFWLAPQNVCFPTAVFGASFLSSFRDAADHIVRWVKDADRRTTTAWWPSLTSSKRLVTIVRRETRKILNIDELAKATEMAGWRVQVLTFERMKVVDQLRAVVDSSVLVGVNGAALQWSVFMTANQSSLIEFAWPSLYWNFFYHHVTNYGIHFRTMAIEPHNVFVNWTSYERAVRLGKTVDETERRQMLKSPPKEVHADSIWKWADFNVNITAFLDVLELC